ncbi:hypothetical protein NBRC111894_2833 [Sporolactobacillus inulinus]|uniref:Uncharacterized protein n=1 Tax=Sporolactobacillus inulinus TaxID=2078 RepID=A0A4Y1ZE50_9BACL|nr:hypothetical protein NBRC111894_2833 [Sporolactobacillus inulinus]
MQAKGDPADLSMSEEAAGCTRSHPVDASSRSVVRAQD